MFYQRGLNICAGEVERKNSFIYSISYLNLWGLGALLGGLSPPIPPRGDGTGC